VYRKLREASNGPENSPPTHVSEFIASILCTISDDHVDDRMACIKGVCDKCGDLKLFSETNEDLDTVQMVACK
ncbi:hypothetical protein KI387_044390, partial [Taxus chinensis]